jgi:hypothetical protein
MAVAITAVEQDSWPTRVLVSLTGLTLGNAVSVYRVQGTTRTPVRAASSASVTDTSFLRVDAELPFGTPVRYVAVVNGVTEYWTALATHGLVGGKVALTDAVSGLSAESVIMAWPDRSWSPKTSVFNVGGRNVVVSGDLGSWEGSIELYVETTSSLASLYRLLTGATSGVIQVRQPGGYDGIDSYIAVTDITEKRWSQDGSDQRRRVTLAAVQVEAWPAALEAAGFTLADIANRYTGGTLATLAGDYATLLAVAQGDFSP